MIIVIHGMTLDIGQVDYIKTSVDSKRGFGFIIYFKKHLDRSPRYVYYGKSEFKLFGKSDREKASVAFRKIQEALDAYRR